MLKNYFLTGNFWNFKVYSSPAKYIYSHGTLNSQRMIQLVNCPNLNVFNTTCSRRGGGVGRRVGRSGVGRRVGRRVGRSGVGRGVEREGGEGRREGSREGRVK